MHITVVCPLCRHEYADELHTAPQRFETRCAQCANLIQVYVCIYADGRPIVSAEARKAG